MVSITSLVQLKWRRDGAALSHICSFFPCSRVRLAFSFSSLNLIQNEARSLTSRLSTGSLGTAKPPSNHPTALTLHRASFCASFRQRVKPADSALSHCSFFWLLRPLNSQPVRCDWPSVQRLPARSHSWTRLLPSPAISGAYPLFNQFAFSLPLPLSSLTPQLWESCTSGPAVSSPNPTSVLLETAEAPRALCRPVFVPPTPNRQFIPTSPKAE